MDASQSRTTTAALQSQAVRQNQALEALEKARKGLVSESSDDDDESKNKPQEEPPAKNKPRRRHKKADTALKNVVVIDLSPSRPNVHT